MTAAAVLLALVTFGRLGELLLARRNTAALLARITVKIASGHYPLIIVLHIFWLVALWICGVRHPVNSQRLAVFLGLQAGRVLTTLGARCPTRIIIVLGEHLMAKAPYGFVNHSNHLVVIGEIAVLPLCLGLPWVARLFSALNAVVLMVRIQANNDRLKQAQRDATA
jgi:methyltransferase